MPTVGDAETISKNLKEYKCARDVKGGSLHQLRTATGKQKYVLDSRRQVRGAEEEGRGRAGTRGVVGRRLVGEARRGREGRRRG